MKVASLAALVIAALAAASITSAATPGASNLRITKADSPDPVRVGSQLTYTLGVENLGPAPATGITVTDNLPDGVSLVSATGPGGPCAADGRRVTCELGTLSPVGVDYGGTSTAVTIVVTPQAPGRVRNTATVRSQQKDPAPGNNRAVTITRVLAAASCRGFTASIVGTAGADLLVGTPGPDVIVARGGNDRVVALAGRDLVCAGGGRDYVGAGTAADRVFGGGGGDRLLGRGGPDVLRGSAGADVLKGNKGADRLRGEGGFDRCLGGAGIDRVSRCER
jgi:uncharacterized repeat protein (TIGR01451 family)